jgi:dephospho-CoA kinase
VVAPETERLRRWERKGGDVEDARRRIAGQIAPSEAFDRADDRIVNDGTLEDLRRKVEEVYRSWRA